MSRLRNGQRLQRAYPAWYWLMKAAMHAVKWRHLQEESFSGDSLYGMLKNNVIFICISIWPVFVVQPHYKATNSKYMVSPSRIVIKSHAWHNSVAAVGT